MGRGATPAEWGWAVETLRTAAEYAATLGVTLAVEPLNRFETYFLNCAEQAVRLVDEVGHPGLGVLYDTFHANIEEKDPVGAVAVSGSRITHVHISENDRSTPGEGHVPWPETFAAVRASGYDGWLTVEAFGRGLARGRRRYQHLARHARERRSPGPPDRRVHPVRLGRLVVRRRAPVPRRPLPCPFVGPRTLRVLRPVLRRPLPSPAVCRCASHPLAHTHGLPRRGETNDNDGSTAIGDGTGPGDPAPVPDLGTPVLLRARPAHQAAPR